MSRTTNSLLPALLLVACAASQSPSGGHPADVTKTLFADLNGGSSSEDTDTTGNSDEDGSADEAAVSRAAVARRGDSASEAGSAGDTGSVDRGGAAGTSKPLKRPTARPCRDRVVPFVGDIEVGPDPGTDKGICGGNKAVIGQLSVFIVYGKQSVPHVKIPARMSGVGERSPEMAISATTTFVVACPLTAEGQLDFEITPDIDGPYLAWAYLRRQNALGIWSDKTASLLNASGKAGKKLSFKVVTSKL
ncbi:MAG TPA: hypothetical protein VGJ91_17175 [Polyangiaceae bacterium]